MVDEVKTDQVQPELTPATPAPVVPPQPQPVQVDEGIKPGAGANIAVPRFDQKPNFVSVEDKKPTWGETARALWNENDFNVIGKAVYNFTYPPAIDHTPDPDFNPLKEAEGTPLAGQTPYLIGFKNKAELDYAIEEARQREHDRETIAANGALGVGLSFVNGGISPAALLPIALGPKSIGQFGRAALSGTVGAAAMEPFYQANDPGRTYEDAIKSLAASTIVAGVLGKGIMYVGERKVKALENEINKIRENAGLNAGQNPIATYDLDNQLAPNAPTSIKIMRDHNGNTAIWDGSEYVDISDNMNPNVPLEETIAKHYGIEDISVLKRTDTPRVEPEISESPVVRESPEFEHHEAVSYFNDNEEVKLPDQATGTGGGLSAQASDKRNLVQKEITPEFLRPVRDKAGEVIAGLAKTVPGGHYVADTYTAVGRFAAKYGKSPVGIIMEHSYSKAARSLLLDVVDTSRQLIGDEVKAIGGALSNHVQVEAERIQVEGLIALEDAYAQHRYGTTNPGFRQRGSGYWPGAKPEGALDYKEFNERVFMAMNKLDTDVEGDPNVTEAAKAIRKLLDPWLERGKKAIHDDGLPLFSEDMHAPLGADSWISHQLDAFKADNNWEEFVGMIYKHLQRDQVVKAEQKEKITLAQRDVVSAQAAKERIANRISTLEQLIKENEIRREERSGSNRKPKSAEDRVIERTNTLKATRKQIQDEIDSLKDGAIPENAGTIKLLEEELGYVKTLSEGAKEGNRFLGSIAKENKERLDILEKRILNQYETMKALRIAEAVADREHVTALDRREKLLMEWEGNSSKAFKSAVKDREAAAEAAGDIEGAPRRASADSAAEDAIRSIIESERDYSDTELMTRANSIAHNWRGRPSTITDYLSEQDPFSEAIPTREGLRGSMKRRTIPIPIEDKIEFLQSDMRTVLGSIARSLPVDVMMTERYGSPEMTRMIDGVREDYDRMLSAERARRDKGFITQSEYKSIEKNMLAQMDLDLQQFTGLNQIMRNRYGYSSDPTNQGLVRVARGLRNWASLTSLGRATLNSFSDAGFGAALKYGVDKVFTDQWVSYGKVLADVPQELFTGKQTALVKQLKRESRALLIGTETMLTLMSHDIDHMTNMGMGNKFERTIAYGANRMQFLNGMTAWTDNVKMATMLMATQQFSDAAERMFKGKGTALDITRFAESNIQPHEAVEIGRMFDKYGSSERDVRFSNVDQWVENDAEKRAAMLYKVAMKREVSTIVPTSNIGIAPIWMSHPLAGILGQFMSFVYASHEQFYLANMQRLNYRMAGALAYGAGLGALSYYAYKMSKGEKPTDNPGQLAKEVIDRMAIVPLYNELAKRVSKATMGQVDPYRMIGADQPLSRRADNDFFDEMLGPGLGVAKKGLQVAGGAAARIATGDPKYFQGKQLHQARQLAWFQNHFFGAPLIFDGGEKLGLKFMNLKPTPGQQRMMNGE